MNKRKLSFSALLTKFFDWISIPKFLLIVAGIVAISVISVSIIFRSKPDIFEAASLSAIQDRAIFRFAVHGEVPGFSFEEDIDGVETWAGLEVDIGREVANAILDDPESVDIFEAKYPIRNYYLDRDIVDCLIGLSPLGYSESQIYSIPYFTDEIVIVVPLEGFTTLNSMHNSPTGARTRIGAITRQPASSGTINPLAHQGALTVLTQYDQDNNADFNIITYSSAPDMFDDLRRGKLDAIAIENAFTPLYMDGEQMRRMVDIIGTVDYAVAARVENSALIEVVNIVISNMINQGDLQALYSKYELVPGR